MHLAPDVDLRGAWAAGGTWPGPRPLAALGCVTAAVVAVATLARSAGDGAWSTSPVLLSGAALTAALLLVLRAGVGEWVAVRRCMAGLALAVLAVPGWGAAVLLAHARDPDGVLTRVLAVLATTAHLPLVAAFSVLPLLAVRYLGRGSSRAGIVVVLVLLAATVACFGLFFDDFSAPLALDAPVAWPPGPALGAAVHAVFLGTVLVGPAVALVAAGRDGTGSSGRRLAVVGAGALVGAGLVMLCAALVGGAQTALGPARAAVVLYLAAYAAVVVVAAGAASALRLPPGAGSAVEEPGAVRTPAPDRDGAGRPADGAPVDAVPAAAGAAATSGTAPQAVDGLGALTPREAEVLGLLAQGLSNAGIAARLTLSQRTVDAHLRAVFAKLDLPDDPLENRRVHAVRAFTAGADAARRASGDG